jgi:hypothetical protein
MSILKWRYIAYFYTAPEIRSESQAGGDSTEISEERPAFTGLVNTGWEWQFRPQPRRV